MSGCVRVRVLMFSVWVFTLITVHADGRGGWLCLFICDLAAAFFGFSNLLLFFRHFLIMLGVRV